MRPAPLPGSDPNNTGEDSMVRTLLALAASAFLSTVALACPGNPDCTDSKCQMAHGETAATAPASLPPGTHATLEVTGMKCGSCADKIASTLKGVDGVNGAVVDAKTGHATVSFDQSKTNVDAMVKAVAALGEFQAKPAPTPPAPGQEPSAVQ